MEKFTILTSKAVPWLMPNVDTDTITPMKRILLNMDNLERYAFEPYRFIDGDGDSNRLNPEFPLNMEQYQKAKIMITGENFGCGSSRETAPEAIRRCGIRCLIGCSFGGIFRKNCFQQGILPILLKKQEVKLLAKQAEKGEEFTVNLYEKCVIAPSGKKYCFEIEDERYYTMLNGWDDVDITLENRDSIERFFRLDKDRRFWLY